MTKVGGLSRLLSLFGYEISKSIKTYDEVQKGLRTKVQGQPGVSKKSRYVYYIKRFLNTNNRLVIFDVGANVGVTASDFALEFPAACIFAFEPFPASFDELSHLASGQIHPVQCAMSDYIGEASFHGYPQPGLNSLLPISGGDVARWMPEGTNVKDITPVRVPVDTIDHFCEKHSIPQIDILKIDTQGSDLHVLKGADDMLSSGRVTWIYVEMHFVHLYEGQCYFHDVYNFLREKNYQLFRFYGDKYSSDGRLMWLNGIFRHSDVEAQYNHQ